MTKYLRLLILGAVLLTLAACNSPAPHAPAQLTPEKAPATAPAPTAEQATAPAPKISTPGSPMAVSDRVTLNFNPDWRFIKEDPANAQAPAFDDSKWIQVSAPHTYNDVDTFDNWSTPGHRGEQIQWSGRTWYRKTFTAPPSWQGKEIYIEFEAVRQVAEVYLNGEKLGVSKTGFTPFGFNLTSHLKIGEPNVLAVMADNRFMKDPINARDAAEIAKRNGETNARPASEENPNLRQLSQKVNEKIPDNVEDLQADQIPWNNPHWHPAHGGIYRDVRLIVVDPLHISLPLYSFLQTEGPYVYATNISPAEANVTVEIPVQNDRNTAENVTVQAQVIDADGKTVLTLNQSESLAAGAKAKATLTGKVTQPRLWEPAYPHVYRVVCSIETTGAVVDSTEVSFGIRAVRWDVAHGFFINGNHLKLTGWGQKPTNEWPGLGTALPDWLHTYTIALMKQAGGNFVRWGHSAAGPAQIRADNALGIVTLQPGVDGESDTVKAAWKLRASAFRDMLIYFRNEPSILIWEAGNQKVTHDHAAELRGYMDRYDPHGGRAFAFRRADAVVAQFMDIGVGTEGGREISALPVVEGEYDREESPRRVWDDASPPNFGYPEAKGMTYQLTSEQYALNQLLQYLKIAPEEHSGGANWIFSDSTSGGRVPAEVSRASGEVDGVRLPKEAYYVCSVIFRHDPQVHIIGHWTYPAGTKKSIYVVSNAEDVELFLNGKSLGHGSHELPIDPDIEESKSRTPHTSPFVHTFANVTFEPGELKAVASFHGKVVATHILRTAGNPVALRITPILAPGGWRADGQDIALLDVEAVDANGERCPTFEQRVDFETTGPAVWRGGYNSGKLNSVNNPWLTLEAGINRVAVRATRTAGNVTVRAKASGLKDGTIELTSKPFNADDGISTVMPANIRFPLAARAPAHPAFNAPNALMKTTGDAKAKAQIGAGKFITKFNYTGLQLAIVHVEVNARDDKNIYIDRDYRFSDLPADLVGADWVQVADADQRYSAVDLMEIAVKGGTVVTIAHDERVEPPKWLSQQFKSTDRMLLVNKQPMRLFERQIDKDESLTFGSNFDGTASRANMYIVLVNAAKK
jgi:beta-galactosidase